MSSALGTRPLGVHQTLRIQARLRDGWAGLAIALGNFEGTFYRYAKRYERRKTGQPQTEPLHKP